MEEPKCPKCKGTGVVRDKNGVTHVCWDCLKAGRLDVHTKDLPDPKIRL